MPSTPCLGGFIFMMGEDQVGPAPMNINRRSKISMNHGATFGMPSRATWPPWRAPLWLSGFGCLPKGEVKGVPFVNIFLYTSTHTKLIDIPS